MVKLSWNGKDGKTNRLSMIHAMDGLTLFGIQDLNEDEVSCLNDEQEILNLASLVSVSDLRTQRNKMKILVPKNAEEFMYKKTRNQRRRMGRQEINS